MPVQESIRNELIQDELSQTDEGATRKECSRTLFSNSVASLSNIVHTFPIAQLDKYKVVYQKNNAN